MSAPFHRVEALFQEPLELPSSERDAFLENACADDMRRTQSPDSALKAGMWLVPESERPPDREKPR